MQVSKDTWLTFTPIVRKRPFIDKRILLESEALILDGSKLKLLSINKFMVKLL